MKLTTWTEEGDKQVLVHIGKVCAIETLKMSCLLYEEDVQLFGSTISVGVKVLLQFGSPVLEDVRKVHWLVERCEISQVCTVECGSLVPLLGFRGPTSWLEAVARGDGVSYEVGVGCFTP